MPVSVNTNGSTGKFAFHGPVTPALLLLLVTLLCSVVVIAGFSVKQMDVLLRNNVLELSGQLELELSRKTEEALSKGIPLEVIFELNLFRDRVLIWDQRLHEWQFQRKILFHALSNQYLITTRLPDSEPVQESFPSLQEALTSMGSFENLELKLDDSDANNGIIFDSSSQLYMDIRARLDIESLPTPLRPVAYTSRSWRLNSGWSSWSVKR